MKLVVEFPRIDPLRMYAIRHPNTYTGRREDQGRVSSECVTTAMGNCDANNLVLQKSDLHFLVGRRL